MTLTNCILICVVLILIAAVTHLLKSNTTLLKKNTELLHEKLEADRDAFRIRKIVRVLNAERYDEKTFNDVLEKLNRDGWQLGLVNGTYFTLWKTERIEEGEK